MEIFLNEFISKVQKQLFPCFSKCVLASKHEKEKNINRAEVLIHSWFINFSSRAAKRQTLVLTSQIQRIASL